MSEEKEPRQEPQSFQACERQNSNCTSLQTNRFP